jgi:hypothetical protein
MNDFELSPEEREALRAELEKRAKVEEDNRRALLDHALMPEAHPTSTTQTPSVPSLSAGVKAGQVVCPRCGSSDYRKISKHASRARHRIAHRVCSSCQQPYRTPIRFRVAKAIGCLTLAVLFCVGGGRTVAVSESPFLWIPILIASAIAVLCSCILLFAQSKVEPLDVVPDDGGQLSERLRQWITSNRGGRLGRAFRFFLRAFGTVMAAAGSLFCFGAGAALFTSTQNRQMPLDSGFFIFLLVLGVVGISLSLIGKSLSARRAVDVLDPDGLRPILFLRSFGDDGARLPTGTTVEQNINPLKSANTLEETLTTTFAEAGPVVAIGRPGETFRPSGAARAYLSDSEWKNWVADLLEWSQQVVMLLGSPNVYLGEADGLAWEIMHVYRNVAPQKIILLIPPHLSEDEVRGRWQLYASLVGNLFPTYRPDAVLIRYEADWTASVVCASNYRKGSSESRFDSFNTAAACARDWTEPASGYDVARTRCDQWGQASRRF